MRLRIISIVLFSLLTAAIAQGECNTAPTDGDEALSGLGEETIDVLANAFDSEGQMLTVEVISTTCPGTTSVEFELIQWDPNPRIYGDCQINYSVQDDLGLATTSTVTITMLTEIFIDDFENGSTSKWSTVQ